MCNDARLPVSQYGSNSLLKQFISTFTDEVCASADSLKTLYDFFDIDTATGQWLDMIGRIVGQPRVAYDGSNQNWFAMEDVAPDPTTSGFGVGKFWDGETLQTGQVIVSDILYRQLIKARIINNRANSTINDVLLVIELVLGRTDAFVLDGGLGDSSTVTPTNMQFVVEFQNPIDDDERSLLLDLDLLPRTAGVALTTVLP